MLKVAKGIDIGFMLFTNPGAEQITADIRSASSDANARALKDKNF